MEQCGCALDQSRTVLLCPGVSGSSSPGSSLTHGRAGGRYLQAVSHHGNPAFQRVDPSPLQPTCACFEECLACSTGDACQPAAPEHIGLGSSSYETGMNTRHSGATVRRSTRGYMRQQATACPCRPVRCWGRSRRRWRRRAQPSCRRWPWTVAATMPLGPLPLTPLPTTGAPRQNRCRC